MRLVVVSVLCQICAVRNNRYYSGPTSDHYDGRFFNTAPTTPDRRLADILRWRRTSQRTPWPKMVPTRSVVPEARVPDCRITLIGHATVLIQMSGLNLVTDPVWSKRASPLSFLGPQRVCPPAVNFADLPKIDVILLSHNHYDHLDIGTLRRLVERDDPFIITPFGNDTIVQRAIPKARIAASDWWDRHELSSGLDITLVPAQHWSARGVRDRRMALWCGFVLRSAAGVVYFAGDTGYGDGSLFRTLHERIGMIDAALLPIGAYAPRWFMVDHHIDPTEAMAILEELQIGHALAIHWGVFPLSDEGRDAPAATLAKALAERRISDGRFLAPEPGHVYDLVRRR